MKILYSFPHPSHTLDNPCAGHIVRANALTDALKEIGVDLIVDQAASHCSSCAANTYRQIIKRLIPSSIAMRLRDRGRVVFGQQYGKKLADTALKSRADIILQTHVAFNLSGKIASQLSGTPLVLDDLAPSWEEQQQYGVGCQNLAKATHQQIAEHASLCVAVSGTMRRCLEKDGIVSDKIIEVPNGIDPAIFHTDVDGRKIRKRFQIKDDWIVIVFIGSFQPFHRVDLLFEALNRLSTDREICLLLVGANSEQTATNVLTEKRGGPSHIFFTGSVDYKEIPGHIAAGDIAVIPATATYCNPMKLYEYMALGKAVIAPDQDNIKEIGTVGKDILTFDSNSVDEFTGNLDLLIRDDLLRRKLGLSAAQTIASGHTWRNRGEKLLAAIEKSCLLTTGNPSLSSINASLNRSRYVTESHITSIEETRLGNVNRLRKSANSPSS